MKGSLIDILPDEILLSILHEWMGPRSIIISSFDVAFCNRYLRRRYLTCWLRSVAPSKMFSNIHFEDIGKNQEQSNDTFILFSIWCKSRNIYPAFLSLSITQTDTLATKSETKQLDLMKHVEQIRVICSDISTVFSNTLNDCRKLKKLTIITRHSTHRIIFRCNNGPYPLVTLELRTCTLGNMDFRLFVQECSTLEVFRIIDCKANVDNVQYLINHAKHLNTIDISLIGCDALDLLGTMEEVERKEISRNTSMKTLNCFQVYDRFLNDVSKTTKILSIFKACPMLEMLYLACDKIIAPLQSEWQTVIVNCWQHLQSVSLYVEPYSFSPDVGTWMLREIRNVCGGRLKRLRLFYDGIEDEMHFISNHFPLLEELELQFYTMSMMKNQVILECLQHAAFRNNLQMLGLITWNDSHHEPVDFAPVLACFPVLKGFHFVSNGTSRNSTLTAFPSMNRLEELIGIEFLPDSVATMACFVNLVKLHLQYGIISKEMLWRLLTLPKLQYLALEQLFCNNAMTLFLPEDYPAHSHLLCPLQELELSGIYLGDVIPLITEELLSVLVFRFSSTLKVLRVAKGTIGQAWRKKYKYSLDISVVHNRFSFVF